MSSLLTEATILTPGLLPCNIKPSDTIFFDKYVYRVIVEGSSIWHDIKLHGKISEFIKTHFINYRENWTVSYRSIYFLSFADVQLFVNEFKFNVIVVEGPVSDNHLGLLSGSDRIDGHSYIIRSKLYFNKFDLKIEFVMPGYKYKYGLNTNKSLSDYHEVSNFVKSNLSDYRWSGGGVFYTRMSLFMLSEDEEFFLPMLKMMYRNNFYESYKVILKNNLTEKNNEH